MSTQFKGMTKELFSGVLHKCGGKVKSWNKRWFVLKDDYCLYYYKDIAKGHLGAISLRDTKFKVRKGEVSDCSWPKSVNVSASLALVTNQRTFYMYAATVEDASTWIRMLEAAREKLLTDSQESNRLLQGTRAQSTSPVRMDDTQQGQRSLASFGRPLSDTTLEVKGEPHPQGTERQLTYEEMCPPPDDSLTNQMSASAPDAFYDLAKPEDGTFVDHQLYMDIEAVQSGTGKPTYSIKSTSPDSTHFGEPTALYDDVEFVVGSTQEKPITEHTNTPQDTYEEVNPELSIKDQPLPPLPIVSVTTTTTSQPIYEDIDTGQPVYESVDPSSEGSKVGMERETVRDVQFEESVNFSIPPRNSGTPPPLPPKDDLPPLPPRDDSPPLPPKDDLPALPPKDDNSPPLSLKDSQTNSPHTPKHVLPLLTLKDDLPPLPPKEEDNYYDDVTSALESENIQLSDLARQHGTPPSPRQVGKNGTPPSPRQVGKNGTPPSPRRVDKNGTPPFPRRVDKNGTPPSPRRVDKNGTPPSPRQVDKNGTPPSPHEVDKNGTPPSPRQVDKNGTPPSPRQVGKNGTPPSPRQVNKNGTPPSPHRVDKNDTPPSPHRVDHTQQNGTPPSPRQETNSPTHQSTRARKPSPSPRRKLPPTHPTSPVENKPRAQTTVSPPPTKEDTRVKDTPKSPDRGGMTLFHSRQERLDQLLDHDSKRRAETILIMGGLTSDPSMSVGDRTVFAETLREMEQERLQASEERFRWERERMKFEEEKRKFEEERRKMQKELETARKLLEQNKT